jgi:hypothetical protein
MLAARKQQPRHSVTATIAIVPTPGLPLFMSAAQSQIRRKPVHPQARLPALLIGANGGSEGRGGSRPSDLHARARCRPHPGSANDPGSVPYGATASGSPHGAPSLIPHLCATGHGDFVLSMPLTGTSFVLTARMDRGPCDRARSPNS